MSELKPIRIGDRVTKFPAQTHNALIAGEQQRRNQLEKIDDLRKPKQKLSVIATIAWAGATDLNPGDTVKLGDALFEPATDAWAPHEGLAFYADAFSAGDENKPYAVMLDPVAALAGGVHQTGKAVIPQAYWAKVDVSNALHQHAARPTTGTMMISAGSGDKIIWRESGTGEKWAIVSMAGATSAETYRLIRGQSYGAQSGGTILLDNVVVLSGGLDPSGGNPATQVTIYNLFGESYVDNEIVDAVYSPSVSVTPAADWETLKTGTGTEKYRLVRGQCVGGVAADATAFNIDNIVILAGGLDPRTVAGDMAETLSIANSQKESFLDNEVVCAIYYDTGWQTILAERYRAIRGTYYSGTTTLQIKNVVPLDSGLDPRSDPGDSDEIVSVNNTAGDTYTSGETVLADYDATSGDWEARPKVGAYIVRGTVDSATSTSASTFTISSLTAVSGPVPSAPLTVQQVFPVGYAAGQATLAMKASNGQWINTPDAGKVLAYTADTTPSYLVDAIADQSTYDADDHQVVYAQAVDSGSGDYKVKLFTAIASGGGGDTVAEGYAIDIAGTTTKTIGFDPTEITGWATTSGTHQLFWHDATATGATDPAWKTISGYYGNKQQFVGHDDTGAWQFFDDKTPVSATLDTTGNSLRLTIVLKDDTEITATIPVASILNALAGYSAGGDQSIGHDASGATTWQGDGTC